MNKYLKYVFFFLFVFLSFNLYFLFLIPDIDNSYLFYLDFLILFFSSLFAFNEYIKVKKWKQTKSVLLKSTELIQQELGHFENEDIVIHESEILNDQLNQQFSIICDLQDYIATWIHEIKIPLSVLYLMNEKNADIQLRDNIREQLEKISQQLNTALVGCKAQSNLYDIDIKRISLTDCIHTSIKNSNFFLIKKHFELDLNLSDMVVYSDKTWLVYVLDQLINNAIKYAKENPYLKISTGKQGNKTYLHIEDHGEGIAKEDLPRIFEKGYTGHGHHNGQYKSTGMGLYFSKMILSRLGHQITVQSIPNKMTCFTICFCDQRDFFNL